MPQSKQPEGKKKQFLASRKSHSRSASIGRNLNKLGRNCSEEQLHRPQLNRSKSTDAMVRRNRSLTKLTSLHPLRRAESHQYVPMVTASTTAGRNQGVIELTRDESESETEGDLQEDIVEEVEQFSEDEQEEQPREEPKVLSYKAPAQFSHTGTSFTPTNIPSEQPLQTAPQEAPTVLPHPSSPKDDEVKLSKITENLKLEEPTTLGQQGTEPPHKQAPQHEPHLSKNDLSDYYATMILSQSTGVVRAFGDQPFQNSLLNLNHQNQAQLQAQLKYIHSNDRISAAQSNSKSSSNSLRQFTINNQTKLGTSHESSILSFKAPGPGLSMTQIPAHDSGNSTPNNFNAFIKPGNANIETRTQQRLWLQRESSLLDLSMQNSTNPQIRREFERISREFLNVRRFENPIIDSVKRVTITNNRGDAETSGQLNNKKIEKLKKVNTEAIQNELLKLWFVNDPSSSNGQSHLLDQHRFQQQQVHQQQLNSRPLVSKHTGDFGAIANGNSIRSMAPTTRAVDRANESKGSRIDLSAGRGVEVNTTDR